MLLSAGEDWSWQEAVWYNSKTHNCTLSGIYPNVQIWQKKGKRSIIPINAQHGSAPLEKIAYLGKKFFFSVMLYLAQAKFQQYCLLCIIYHFYG